MTCLGFAFEAVDRFLGGLGTFPNWNLGALGMFVARLILFEDRVELILSGRAFGLDPSLCKDIRR